MSYEYWIKPGLKKKLEKIAKKDSKIVRRIVRKIEEVSKKPHHYKNLRAPLQDWKRVHIFGSFVLLFSVDEMKKRMVLEDLDHHDRIYKS